MENSFDFYITSEGFTIDKSAMAKGVLPVRMHCTTVRIKNDIKNTSSCFWPIFQLNETLKFISF